MPRVLKLVSRCFRSSVLTLILIVLPQTTRAAGFKAIHFFTGDNGDCNPLAGLVLDGAGNLYGTAAGGLCNGFGWNGTIFKLAPQGPARSSKVNGSTTT